MKDDVNAGYTDREVAEILVTGRLPGGLDVEGVVYDALADRTSDQAWLEEASAHVAAVLREQIAAAQAEAWDEGYERRAATLGMTADPNPYRAAQVAPSRVPGEGS